MRVVGFLAVAMAAGLSFAASTALFAAEPNSGRDLAGLWVAAKHFGPEIRGALIVRRSGETWSADIAGRTTKAGADHGRISFSFGEANGSFRGRLEPDGNIRGHWIQPRGVIGGSSYASPVVLMADGQGRWRGDVSPLGDDLRLYLMLTAKPDGSVGAFFRNPERNVGLFLNPTRMTRDGQTVKLIGRQRGNANEDVVAEGRYDARAGTLSFPFEGRGGPYVFSRASGDSDFYPRGKASVPYAYHPPGARDDGWPTASLEEVGISRAGIEKFVQMLIDTPIDSVHAQEVHGVLIARHGKLVLEEYFHGENRDKPHDTRSAAKSLAATMLGAAMQAGVQISPSTPVYQTMNGGALPADLEPRKRAMTVENLLTMSSGFFCDDSNSAAPGNENVMQDQTAEADWYRYALKLPMAGAPGEKAVYCSTNPNLLGGVLSLAAGEPLVDLFDRLIGRRMQFGRYALFLQPTGEAYMGGGAHFLPRDFLKIAQLMVGGGIWNGQRIVSADWVARATAPRYDLAGIKYGYLWWVTDLPHKGRTVRAFFAGGNGGQVAMGIPELDLVVGFYGGNYGDQVLFVPQRVYVPAHILPAVN